MKKVVFMTKELIYTRPLVKYSTCKVQRSMIDKATAIKI